MDSCWRMPLMAATRGFGKVWPAWGWPRWWAYSRASACGCRERLRCRRNRCRGVRSRSRCRCVSWCATLDTRRSRRCAGGKEGEGGLRSDSGRCGCGRCTGILAHRTSRRALAAGRVATRGGRADEILAVKSVCKHTVEDAARVGETPLDCRAGLPGAEAGTRTGPFRGPCFECVSASRHTMHCGVWVTGGRHEPFSPSAQGRRLELSVPRSRTATSHGTAPGEGRRAAPHSIPSLRQKAQRALLGHFSGYPFCGARHL